MTQFTDDMTVCILAGGLSKRLRPVTDTIPKPLVPVDGKPFLQLQMEHFSSLGFRRFVLAVSYLWEQIRDHFGDGARFGWQIDYSVERDPLDTGGAVLWAQPFWGARAIVANGDTFLPEDWRAMIAVDQAANLPATIALVCQRDCSRFGKITICDGRVTSFEEKTPHAGPGWINAGVYILRREAFDRFQRGQRFSMERDVLPSLAGSIAAYECTRPFADIGTPESLAAFRARDDIELPTPNAASAQL